ncbi:uncharacterized protein LOC105226277 isoform X1 [Bactrocera dorsalis]|uniref:Uncharacterized protein LOC105226277 isoform X1 n=1 Tax=Bactrocera dorsalis TaxID=27457 RepID=A0ABM3JGT4_BACDO|nr:uncharacterized protein LOC105226277 isoform X1 [Bactrocera dorsalis]XP_049308440.1 uncharacterized protein LOC105226277 isoform X1 [Bactrocera dorsalis]
MEDPSIKKRLIDFGIDEHEYDEVQELPDESNINPQIATTTTDLHLQQQQQPLLHNTNNNNTITTDTPPELPPPKQNKLKNSKKSKSKSKIPRSPSLAASSSAAGSSGNISITNNNNNSNFGSGITYSPIPPQTPPLPVNYQQSKLKHMNGGNITPTTPLANFGAGFSPVTPTTPTILVSNSVGGNNVAFASTPTGGSVGGVAVMGGGSVPLSGGLGANGTSAGGGVNVTNAGNQRGSVNMASARRPQLQITPIPESPKNFQYLTLTVRKDENGYGMKVSGDNPVFVESVKPGGAAQIAGLVAGDMILKVNGQEVRMEKHPTVVGLIKASTIVELAVKRSQKLTRPTSVGIVPSTPILSGRDRTASITGPQPVDSIKRREMETYKIQTLQKMLEQEKLNLERLKGDTTDPSYKLSEANIRKLREQLRKIGAEDAPTIKLQPTANNNKNTAMLSPAQLQHLSVTSHHNHLHPHQPTQLQQPTITTPQVQSSPAFLSLLPRSLSSLSLGTRKNKIDKDLITAPLNNTTDFLHHHHHQHQLQQQHNNNAHTSPLPPYNMSQSLHQPQTQTTQQHRNSAQQALFYQQQQQQQQQLQSRLKETPKSSNSKSKNKYAAQAKTHSIQEDTPPPLPQRNPPRQLQLDNNGNSAGVMSNSSNATLFAPISDLDMGASSPQGKSPQPTLPPPPSNATANSAAASSSSSSSAQKKRSKTKTKALSDPKMSTQMFLQMETAAGANAADAAADGGSCETDCIPPPLPPRQPGMLEESPHRGSFSNLHAPGQGGGGARPPPNSIETLLNYPLVSTCTPVHRDNMAAAFPLSQRPNIVQQLQQHQQQQQQQQLNNSCAGQASTAAALGQTPPNLNHLNKHRRVVSEHMHSRHPDRINKTTSGSWELVEKDGEVTPPGTPPPPYLTMSGAEEQLQLANDSVVSGGGGGIFIESHHFTPLAAAVSPTPTPPLTANANTTNTATHSSRILAAQANITQKEIISMEDEDASDQEGPFIDENGPFNHLQRLLEPENVAFLAVFLNYVLSNSEPAPLLFYLITGLYKEGTAKDMRKWAYEIHSTFLVPRAPLSWYRKDESLAREVDNVLQSEFDKVEILRKVFWKSRKCARDTICAQLREFQQTRTEGLGTIYGPTDAQLAEARGDKQREQHIFEETLMRKLQVLIEEYEKDSPLEDPKKLALCSALSTVIHRIFITRSHPNSIVDRVHHFVSREKSFKSRLMGKNRKMIVRGHPLVLRQYYEVTHCNHCQTIIWGVSPQGYHCTDCKLNIHRPCSKVLDENCPGPLPQSKRKEPHNDNKISKFMGKIRPRTSSDFISSEKRARHEEDFDPDFSSERLHTSSIVRQPSDRRPDAGNQALRSNGTAATSADSTDDVQLRLPSSGAYPAGGPGETGAGIVGKGATGRGARESNVPSSGDATGDLGGTAAAETSAQDAAEGKDARRERLHQHHQNKSAPVSVNRSESYKERLSQKRNRNSRRKTSDPSLTSRPNDEQADVGLSNSNFTASSNSSLSSGGGSESPSTSMEQMGGAGGATATATGHPITHHHSMHAHHTTPHHHMHQHSHQDSFHGSIGGGSMNTSFWGSSFGGVGSGQPGQRQWNFESDEEDDLNEADWSSNVTAELLAALTDAEKKRQEIINEIYQTERSHVRILKLLERLFLLPLQDSSLLTAEHLSLLFPPALLSLREIHTTFEQQLKQRRVEHNHVVTHIGDLLSGMFFGKSGDDLCQYAQQFCARQQIALEALKEKRRKDEQLQKLLTKAESHKACRRLQLKDLLPAVLQRLTKYPLLFENLYKVTIRVVPDDVSEAEAIRCALESSKKILVDVNQAVKTAEDTHKLQNIQRKLDKSTFDKDEFKNLDLTQYRLIHDGSLTMKKNPSIQLHGLLFEDMIVLLTKQDDKYSLKYLHAPRNTEVNNKPVNPIMSIDSETLVRQEAADKNSFFLIKTKTSQMLELRAPSSSECKTWFKHISDAAEQYKPRSKNANHEPVDDPAIATIPHSNTKESLELTPERPQPASAIATVTTTPLAPMMPVATATSVNVNNNNNNDHHNVQLRNGRRESISTAGSADHKMRLSHNELSPSIGSSSAAISSASTASLSSSSAAVNRTMSTRSCGEPNNNNGGYENASVTLRHTQSARQANGHNAGVGADEFGSSASGAGIGSGSKRDSASIVYSNNSNNTRTLMQSSPPLVEPTAIQISISPAHTAEPVLTPAERLRRLDVSIRDGLLEKQKIICDMFRLPVEHFHEIVDIAAMPEAPKDSADIALAAYAQVQSLTEVLNEYMHVTPEQEISAVSTAVCDQCHEKQQQHHHHHSQRPLTPLTAASSNSSSTSTMNSTGSSTTTQIAANGSVSAADIPPPLPPPNKQIAQQQTPTAKTPTSVRTVLQNALMDEDIHEDDDGYCEIDELRLPALPPTLASKTPQASSPPPPLPPPAGSFKAPPLPPPPAAIQQQQQQLQQQNQQEEEKCASNATIVNTTLPEETATTVVTQTGMAELVKRQSTISADSIPEESADEVSQALNEGHVGEPATAEQLDAKHKAETVNTKEDETAQPQIGEKVKTEAEQDKVKLEVNEEQASESKVAEDAAETTTTAATIGSVSTTNTAAAAEPQSEPSATQKSAETEDKPAAVESTTVCDDKEAATTATVTTTAPATAQITSTNDTNTHNDEEHMEVNDAYETLSTLSSKLNSALAMVDHSTQTTPIALSLNTLATSTANTNTSSSTPVHCGPNRIQHANSLEPSVPCHALNAIVSSLNSQISLLLPKINERDMERERLRKENQHLRELLNAMHERQRVEAKLETPTDATAVISSSGDAATADEIDGTNNTNSTTPQMQSNSATTDVTAAAATSATTSVTLEGVSSEATNVAVNNTTTTTVAADTTKATTTSAECDN